MGMFSHQTDLNKPFRWLLISFLIKISLYFIFIYNDAGEKQIFHSFFLESRDHEEYIEPIDNFIEKGTYSLSGHTEPYAGRLPGFVFPYILFRALFSESTALILLGIFILVLSLIASYLLALLMFHLTKKRWTFFFAFILMNCIPFYWHFDWSLHVNSLAASCLVFFLYYVYSYFENRSPKNLLLAGFFITWLALLRGFCLVFLPIALVCILIFLFRHENSLKTIFMAGAIFILPMGIFETAWIIRNYVSLHEFIPLQTSFVPGTESKNPEYNTGTITKGSMMSVRKLIFAWGGDNTWYFPDSDMAWFIRDENPIAKNFKFDERIFFDGFTVDSLNILKSSIIYSFANIWPHKQQDSIENVITATAERYREKFVRNKPLYYYCIAPGKRLKNYLFKNPTQDWPGRNFKSGNILQRAFKLLSVAEYAVLVCIGFLFPFIYLFRRKKADPGHHYGLLYSLLLSNVLLFMFVILMSHYSYFIFGYILLIPLTIFSITLLNRTNS